MRETAIVGQTFDDRRVVERRLVQAMEVQDPEVLAQAGDVAGDIFD